jgi:hypothetical protein
MVRTGARVADAAIELQQPRGRILSGAIRSTKHRYCGAFRFLIWASVT